MANLDIEKANSRYVLRTECKVVRQSIGDNLKFVEGRLDKIDTRLWGLVMLAIAQLVGIAVALFKLVVR